MTSYSKLDVAKRELEFAIRLFFLEGEQVIIHISSSSAKEILKDICGEEKSMDFEFLKLVKDEKKKEVRKLLKNSYNYMKHSERDKDDILEFDLFESEVIILDCINLYFQLSNETSGLMRAFRLWFYTQYPKYLKEKNAAEMFKKLSLNFDLSNKSNYLLIANELENKRTV